MSIKDVIKELSIPTLATILYFSPTPEVKQRSLGLEYKVAQAQVRIGPQINDVEFVFPYIQPRNDLDSQTERLMMRVYSLDKATILFGQLMRLGTDTRAAIETAKLVNGTFGVKGAVNLLRILQEIQKQNPKVTRESVPNYQRSRPNYQGSRLPPEMLPEMRLKLYQRSKTGKRVLLEKLPTNWNFVNNLLSKYKPQK